MLKHNLLLFFRDIKKYKTTFLINLVGLSSGLACVLLIYLWVNDELNMNTFNEKDSARHVQVIHTYPTSGTLHTNTNGFTPNPLWMALPKSMPEIEYSFPVKAHPNYKGILSTKNNNIRVKYQFIGKGYFNVFPGDFVHGNKHKVLSDKNEIVISKKLAMSLFQSTEDAMGKTVVLKDEAYGGPYTVTGVFNPNANTSVKFDVLLSYERFLDSDLMQWYNGGTQAHLVLKEGVSLDQFNAKIKNYLKTLSENWNDLLYAQPYSEKYLYGKYENGVPVSGRIIYVRLFSIVALFILFIACINYMNFSTAKASRRVKEIGIKKAIGVKRKSLIIQFFGESIFTAFLSLVIALVLISALLPQFNEISGKQLHLSLITGLIPSILVITILTGLLSGIYPAFHLSGFKSFVALKGKIKNDLSSLWLRKGLVVFQFTISVILIVSVIVFYKQIEFIQTTNLGYNKDHIITFSKEGKLEKNAEAFILKMKDTPGVLNASQMSGDLPGRISSTHGYTWEGMNETDKKLKFYQIRGGYDLIKLLGITLKDGRDFSRDFSTDKDAIIMNETAVKMIGLKNPVGQKFGNLNPNENTKEIIGVVKDFHFQSLQEKMRPFFFSISDYAEKFIVKIQAGTEIETINKIEKIYADFNDGYPFEYSFLDENYQALYASEERITKLSRYFAGIAILISCLGLFGLAIFTAEARKKEIGIRKTLGQKKSRITLLLSNEFAKLVVIAIVIGLPIAFILMKNWLSEFAYKIELRMEYFLLTALLAISVAFVTVASQAVRAANKSPIDVLREE